MTETIMNSDLKTDNTIVRTPKPKSRLRRKMLNPLFCTVVASFGIFGGISALFVGLICVVIHSLLVADRAFDGVGTALLIAAIPMILVGSVFLDEIDKK